MYRYFISCLMLIVLVSCKNEHKPESAENQVESSYKEQYRPQFHFSPEEKWMNYPNGLVYNDGLYHLFYQYYPDDIVWGPMHWGHAVSTDLTHWEHKPIALYPDENGLIFSGSAVVDTKNTSGFGENGKIPLVAIFTYHSMDGERAGRKDFQTQGIAYSLDNGDTWTKYADNPVIGNEGIKDFRDPKVFWHEPSKSWILTLVAGDHAKFYTSKNLKDWEHLSDFGRTKGAHGGVWECPDLFPLKINGSDEEKWVLIISINPGAPNGGSGTQYFVGDFDGRTFSTDQKEPKWLDYGADNYAGVTYNNVPNGERIFIGWMSNWDYARDTPTKKWRSAMTLPRKLSLYELDEDYFQASYPIETVDKLSEPPLIEQIEVPPGETSSVDANWLNQSEIRLTTASKKFKLLFKNASNEELELFMDVEHQKFEVDRTLSGKIDFQQDFGASKHVAPLIGAQKKAHELRIFMDWSSMELFIDQGLVSMTEQVFPTSPYDTLIIVNEDNEAPIQISAVSQMNSIW